MDVKIEVERHLLISGFDLVEGGAAYDFSVFKGELQRSLQQSIEVAVFICDWTFSSYPKIILCEGGRHDATVSAHINIDRSLCYAVPGEVVLNSLAPTNAIELCITLAIKLIDRIDRNDPLLLEEYRDEFFAYWVNDFTVFFSYDNLKCNRYALHMQEKGCNAVWLVPVKNMLSDHPFSKLIGNDSLLYPGWGTVIQVGEDWPSSSSNVLPRTLGEFLEWVRVNSPKALGKFISATALPEVWLGWCFSFIIKTPSHTLVALLNLGFEDILVGGGDRKTASSKAGLRLYERDNILNQIPVLRCVVQDVSSDFVFSRNFERPEAAINILVVGCGSVGGFLVQALAKSGLIDASTSITIVDDEVLEPGNISRHLLGMNSLGSFKATSLKAQLELELPHVNIVAWNTTIQKCLTFDYDLVIDATGEEAVSRWINQEHYQYLRNGGYAPVLYVWLEGEGTASRALLVDNDSSMACYECIYQHGNNGDRKLRFPHETSEINYRHVGCKAVVPYAVSAAMQAATLGSELAVDYAFGAISPRFRGINRSGRGYQAFEDSDLSCQPECPVCGAE